MIKALKHRCKMHHSNLRVCRSGSEVRSWGWRMWCLAHIRLLHQIYNFICPHVEALLSDWSQGCVDCCSYGAAAWMEPRLLELGFSELKLRTHIERQIEREVLGVSFSQNTEGLAVWSWVHRKRSYTVDTEWMIWRDGFTHETLCVDWRERLVNDLEAAYIRSYSCWRQSIWAQLNR